MPLHAQQWAESHTFTFIVSMYMDRQHVVVRYGREFYTTHVRIAYEIPNRKP